MENKEKKEVECCPPFDPAPWEDKVLDWDKKKFIRESVFTFLYMPVNFGQKMRKLDKLVTKAGAAFSGSMCLSD
ncbi:MAG: hydrolase, partial [Bacteroidales bacterium]